MIKTQTLLPSADMLAHASPARIGVCVRIIIIGCIDDPSGSVAVLSVGTVVLHAVVGLYAAIGLRAAVGLRAADRRAINGRYAAAAQKRPQCKERCQAKKRR